MFNLLTRPLKVGLLKFCMCIVVQSLVCGNFKIGKTGILVLSSTMTFENSHSSVNVIFWWKTNVIKVFFFLACHIQGTSLIGMYIYKKQPIKNFKTSDQIDKETWPDQRKDKDNLKDKYI